MHISRVEIFSQRRDRLKWDVLKSPRPSWAMALSGSILLFIMIASIVFGLPDISQGAQERTRERSTTAERATRQKRAPTVLMATEERPDKTSTPRTEKNTYNKNVERWRALPPDEKKELRDRMDQWRNLSPQEQDTYRRRHEKLQEMPPSQRKKIDQGLEKWDTLPPTEKEEIRELFEE